MLVCLVSSFKILRDSQSIETLYHRKDAFKSKIPGNLMDKGRMKSFLTES